MPEPRYFFLIATAVVLWVAASTGQSSVREKKILNLARDSDGKKISFHGFLPEVRDTIVIRIVEFSSGDTKLERFLPKNQHTVIPHIVSAETILV